MWQLLQALNLKIMKRLLLLFVLLFAFFSLPNFAQSKRIKFRSGHSSATVRGKIGPQGNGGYLEYIVEGRKGQLMSIAITSGNGAVIVNAGTASGKSFSLDMTGGDHQLSIVNTKPGKTTYVLKVSIK